MPDQMWIDAINAAIRQVEGLMEQCKAAEAELGEKGKAIHGPHTSPYYQVLTALQSLQRGEEVLDFRGVPAERSQMVLLGLMERYLEKQPVTEFMPPSIYAKPVGEGEVRQLLQNFVAWMQKQVPIGANVRNQMMPK